MNERYERLKNDVLSKPPLKGKDLSVILNTASNWGDAEVPKKSEKTQPHEEERLISWSVSEIKKGIITIPKKIELLSIYGGIILAVNLIFWTIEPYFLPSYLQPFRTLISAVVFLTATYNDVIPKTIFWVIIFTFGRRLLKQMRKRGFKSTFACMGRTIPQFKSALERLGRRAYPAILAGVGIGLVVANNFASYSRFSGARNKIDKYFIVIVIAFTISYLLGEANKTGIFKFVKLGSKDLGRLIGRPSGLSDDGVYLFLSALVAGMILDAPLILMKWMYGGYILGAVAIIASVGLMFVSGPKQQIRGGL